MILVFKRFWIKLKTWSTQRISFTVAGVTRNFLNFVVAYTASVTALWLAHWQGKGTVTCRTYLIIYGGSGLLVIINYFREYLSNLGRERRKLAKDIIFKFTSSAIAKLKDCYKQPESNKSFEEATLRFIERTVKELYPASFDKDIEITANLMEFDEQSGMLVLTSFGTFGDDRKIKLSLNVDQQHPLPGAPEAFVFDQIVYIPDTYDETVRDHFKPNRPYHCIISIPLCNSDRPFGVLNIDSNETNGFGNTEYISKEILPTIKPFVRLLELRSQLYHSN